jgi:hypothetical protein
MAFHTTLRKRKDKTVIALKNIQSRHRIEGEQRASFRTGREVNEIGLGDTHEGISAIRSL